MTPAPAAATGVTFVWLGMVPAMGHHAYIVLETAKVAALPVTGILLLTA
ncbi:hypothetical protein [Streptosporangium sp. NPDC001681]